MCIQVDISGLIMATDIFVMCKHLPQAIHYSGNATEHIMRKEPVNILNIRY